MSDLLNKSAQLPLIFDPSDTPSEKSSREAFKSNVISVGFGHRRSLTGSELNPKFDEQQILEDVLREAKKLKW